MISEDLLYFSTLVLRVVALDTFLFSSQCVCWLLLSPPKNQAFFVRRGCYHSDGATFLSCHRSRSCCVWSRFDFGFALEFGQVSVTIPV